MKTLDKYIVRNFLSNVVLCLVAIMLLRVTSDLFFNMDEFAESKGQERTIATVLSHISSYYSYQSLVYFRQLGGVVIVVAATFTLWRMNHTNELTAVLASGVSLHRVLLPIVICAMGLNLLVVLDSEVLIPPVKYHLVRSRDDVSGTGAFKVRLIVDSDRSAWYSGRFDPRQGRLDHPLVHLRDERLAYVGYITGPSATYDKSLAGWVFAPDQSSPVQNAVLQVAGWRKAATTAFIPTSRGPADIIARARARPENGKVDWRRASGVRGIKIYDASVGLTIRADRLALKVVGGRVIGTALENVEFIYQRRDGEPLARFVAAGAVYDGDSNPPGWALTAGRLICPSDLTPDQMALRQSGNWLEYMSTAELTRLLRLKRVPNAEGAMLVRHSRFADFFNSILMLLVAVPFILSRERDVKVSAGLALLMVGGTFVFIYLARYVGVSAMVAAWLPMIVIGPISAVLLDSIKT